MHHKLAQWSQRHVSSQNALIGLLILLALLAIGFVWVMLSNDPKWSFCLLGVGEPKAGKPKYEVLKFIGIGMGGVLLALQALMSYKRAKALENTAKAQADAANAQAKATEEQAKANQHTEQGQRQERMKNAIEHLGHDKGSVRLGGAYELFHLAEDTQSLNQTALDILCAHVRQITGESSYQKESKPSEEVQSLLTLLFVQEHKVFEDLFGNLQGSYLKRIHLKRANLERAQLQRAQLQEAQLQGACLKEANLERAQLQEAQLQGARLKEANLERAQLQRAQLQGAHLKRANLERANLEGARLKEANLERAQLQRAQLQRAQLQEAQLQGAQLQEAQLQGAQLQEAQLQGARLKEANLERAQLQEVQLQGAYLQEAQLQGAQLQGAQLQGAYLQGARLWGANLEGAQLQGARLWGANLEGAQLQGARLWGANLEGVQLQGANLEGAQLQGAYLREGQLQGTNLQKADLQGVRCEDPFRQLSFEDLIRESIRKGTDLSGVVFKGGLSQEYVDSFIEGLSDEETKKEWRAKLEPHIGQTPSNQLPYDRYDSDPITGSYTAEKAEQWIAEYKEAMSEVPTPSEIPAPTENPNVAL